MNKYLIYDYHSYKIWDWDKMQWVSINTDIRLQPLSFLQSVIHHADWNFPWSALIVEHGREYIPIVLDDGPAVVCYYVDEEDIVHTGSNVPNGQHIESGRVVLESISDAIGNDLDCNSFPYQQAERLFQIMM